MKRAVEINQPPAEVTARRLRQHLASASGELYLLSLEYSRVRKPVPAELKRAHRAIKAELRRVEGEGSPP